MATTVKTLRARLVADVSDFNKKMDKAAKKFDAVAKRLTSVGTKLSLGITVPLVALGANAVKTAAKFDILERKFAAVFGNTAKETKKFSKELAGATGRSAIKVRELLSGTQDLLTGFGVTTEKATDLSKQFNTLALDVASFQNVSDDQVIKAFNSAITGETEALKTLGVKISQADINQRLLNDGVKDGIKGATAAQKAQAILALITGQTGNAAGKAAEFANTMAGRLRALSARALDLRVELGNRLIPVAEKVVGFFERMLDAIDMLDESTKKQAITFAILGAAVGPVILGLGLMLKILNPLATGLLKTANAGITLSRVLLVRFAPLLVPILAIGAAVGAIITVFAVAKRALKINGIDIVKSVKTMSENAVGFLTELFRPAIDFIIDGFNFLKEKVQDVIGFISEIPGVKAAFTKLGDFVAGFKDEAVASAKFTAEFIEKSFEDLGKDVKPIFMDLVASFKEQMAKMLEAAGVDVPAIQAILNTLRIPNLAGGPEGAAAGATGEGKDTGAETPGETTGGIFSGVQDFFKNLTKDISATDLATQLASDSINSFADGIADAALSGEDFGETMKQVFKEVVAAIVKAIIKMLILKALSSAFGGPTGAVANVGTSLQTGGRIPAGGFRPVGEAGTELAAGPAQIIPFAKLGGGGGVNIIINNESNAEISTERTTSDDGAEEIRLLVQNVISEDFARGGPAARAIQNSFAGVRTRVTG